MAGCGAEEVWGGGGKVWETSDATLVCGASKVNASEHKHHGKQPWGSIVAHKCGALGPGLPPLAWDCRPPPETQQAIGVRNTAMKPLP